MRRFLLPFLRLPCRARNTGKKLYESMMNGPEFMKESPYIKNEDFFEGYEEEIKVNNVPCLGQLLILPTPIGNLRDISLRVYQNLKAADILACEDTRVTGLLLQLLEKFDLGNVEDVEFPPKNISNKEEKDEFTYALSGEFLEHTVERIRQLREEKGRGIMIAFTSFNQEARTPKLIKAIKAGLRVALVSDAGTPLISDPGSYLVRAAAKEGVTIEALPGPVAAITALCASGFPAERFFFQGYLSKTESEKIEKLENMKASSCTCILYESSHRILNTLNTISKVYGNFHPIYIGQELTKFHERHHRGTVQSVYNTFYTDFQTNEKIYGELTIVISPYNDEKKRDEDMITIPAKHLLQVLSESIESTPTNMKKLLALITGRSNNSVSRLMKSLDEGGEESGEDNYPVK
jgi:16S rRNA (cytidine1402-2'-O)-methyltransferase